MIERLPYYWGIVLLCIVWTAALKDVKSFTIPHIYPACVILLWLISLPFVLSGAMTPTDLVWNVIAAVIAFIIGFALFALRMMGGGDVKLFAALALWITLRNLHVFVVLVVLLGLVYTLIYAAASYVKRRQTVSLDGETRRESYNHVKRSRIPYGPAIALGLSAYSALLWA